MTEDSASRARDTWRQAQQDLGGDIAALEFGASASCVAVGGPSAPIQVVEFGLGIDSLAAAYLRAPRPGEAAIEAAITEVEERVMPLRALLPAGSRCVTQDARVARIARALGLPAGPWVTLATDTVEQGFNRWVSVALGRPATQETLPTTPEFAASLLILRECLHHLGFAQIQVG